MGCPKSWGKAAPSSYYRFVMPLLFLSLNAYFTLHCVRNSAPLQNLSFFQGGKYSDSKNGSGFSLSFFCCFCALQCALIRTRDATWRENASICSNRKSLTLNVFVQKVPCGLGHSPQLVMISQNFLVLKTCLLCF